MLQTFGPIYQITLNNSHVNVHKIINLNGLSIITSIIEAYLIPVIYMSDKQIGSYSLNLQRSNVNLMYKVF